ncbi:MAG: hypothetical protein N3D18_01685 [Roseococcus sp.]|nr:hypothetical protein [Roseococcus sp.]
MPPTPDACPQPVAQGRGRPRADQAALWLLIALVCAGCDAPARLDLRAMLRDATGAAAEERLPPPGLDRPFPHLASVPPVPERPDPATRQRITEALQRDRAASETPVPASRAAAPLTEPEAPGAPPLPARPPAPPRLARAAPIPWAAPAAPGAPPGGGVPGDVPEPREVPAAPPEELLAPGAPPPPPALLSR